MSLACSSAACCLRHPKACLTNFEGTNVDLRAPPHITFVAFEGKDRGVIRELALSAFSLSRTTPSATMHILTDTAVMAARLREAHLPPGANIKRVDREAVLRKFEAFGLYRFSHHSGLGGYSKLILADLLPDDLQSTVLVDTDTVFVADVAPMWALRKTLASRGSVLAAKRLSTGGVCLRGQRINSGVVLMDLQRMRKTNWTGTLLERVRGLRGQPARQCGKMLRGNDTLAAGDQELLSFGCLQAGSSACIPLQSSYHQDKCDGFVSTHNPIVIHFNCNAKAKGQFRCPTSECSRIVSEFERTHPISMPH